MTLVYLKQNVLCIHYFILEFYDILHFILEMSFNGMRLYRTVLCFNIFMKHLFKKIYTKKLCVQQREAFHYFGNALK